MSLERAFSNQNKKLILKKLNRQLSHSSGGAGKQNWPFLYFNQVYYWFLAFWIKKTLKSGDLYKSLNDHLDMMVAIASKIKINDSEVKQKHWPKILKN